MVALIVRYFTFVVAEKVTDRARSTSPTLSLRGGCVL
jgi:hypothetical protein